MNARFAVGKLRNLDIAEGGVELFRDLPRQGKIGIARKQFDLVAVCNHFIPSCQIFSSFFIVSLFLN